MHSLHESTSIMNRARGPHSGEYALSKMEGIRSFVEFHRSAKDRNMKVFELHADKAWTYNPTTWMNLKTKVP